MAPSGACLSISSAQHFPIIERPKRKLRINHSFCLSPSASLQVIRPRQLCQACGRHGITDQSITFSTANCLHIQCTTALHWDVHDNIPLGGLFLKHRQFADSSHNSNSAVLPHVKTVKSKLLTSGRRAQISFASRNQTADRIWCQGMPEQTNLAFSKRWLLLSSAGTGERRYTQPGQRGARIAALRDAESQASSSLENENEEQADDGEEEEIKSEDGFFAETEATSDPWSGSTYEKAKNLLSSLAQGVSKLEIGFISRKEELGDSSQKIDTILGTDLSSEGPTLREAEENVRKLELQVQKLQRERATGELKMAETAKNYEQVYSKLKEAEKMAAQAQFLQEEVEVRQEEKVIMQQQLEAFTSREEEMLERARALEDGLAQRNTLLQQLQHESALSSQALQQAAKAMVAARDRTLRMEEQLEYTGDLLAKERQNTSRARERSIELTTELTEAKQQEEELKAHVEQLAEEVVNKEILIEKTKEESLKTRDMLELTQRALGEAQDIIKDLNEQVRSGQDKLRQEIESSSEALKNAAQKEHALRQSDLKVRELTAELFALKEEMTNQEQAMAVVRDETVKNAKLLMQAAQTRQELEQARTRIAQLEGQVGNLEGEVQSRDALLEDLRSEINISTEALEVAAMYKKELNRSKEREAELEDDLEAREALVAEMRKELAENMRAQRAEHALRVVERRVLDLEEETVTLRRGVETRDQALAMMKNELEQSAEMLKAAATNREALRELQHQVQNLKAELEQRDERRANERDANNSYSQRPQYQGPSLTQSQNLSENQSNSYGSSFSTYDEDQNSANYSPVPSQSQSPAYTQRRGSGVGARGARRGGYGPSRTPR